MAGAKAPAVSLGLGLRLRAQEGQLGTQSEPSFGEPPELRLSSESEGDDLWPTIAVDLSCWKGHTPVETAQLTTTHPLSPICCMKVTRS